MTRRAVIDADDNGLDVNMAIIHLAAELKAAGWVVNIGVETGGDAERFSLSGVRFFPKPETES